MERGIVFTFDVLNNKNENKKTCVYFVCTFDW